MNQAILKMLEHYECVSLNDYKNALKEIIQEIILMGLWRAKFFEHAAFYGGTALRIFYGLDRFSEDLDFSLLIPDSKFKLSKYEKALEMELMALGFDIWVESKKKQADATIQSAFVKGNTIQNLIKIKIPNQLQSICHTEERIKIKFEIDVDPPQNFSTESRFLLRPSPFSVRTYTKPDLFAGKLHALLCRNWKQRVKGRDWYDFVWYVTEKIPVNLRHLETRMWQTGHLQRGEPLTHNSLINKIEKKIENLDIDLATKDVLPLLKNPLKIKIWSHSFFSSVTKMINSL